MPVGNIASYSAEMTERIRSSQGAGVRMHFKSSAKDKHLSSENPVEVNVKLSLPFLSFLNKK